MRWCSPPLLFAMLAALCLGVPAGSAAAASKRPVVSKVRCVPADKSSCKRTPRVAIGERVRYSGRNFKRGMRVTFRWKNGALATKLRITKSGWVATVPAGTKLGTVRTYLTDKHGFRSNQRKVRIVAGKNDPNAGKPVTAIRPARGETPEPFKGDGMWIWNLPRSEGGNLDRIAARALAAGMKTVFVKSSDAGNLWSQFNPAMIQGLKARGLNVCGWQFVYGTNPKAEARAAIANIQAGADCFVIDAETRYEGRYRSAAQYLSAIREAVGDGYPIALTSFPYVDYHARLPYSVFLNPVNGAQVNMPQVYWKDIGGTVDAVSAKTLAQNRIYGTPIAPIGQTYNGPPTSHLRRFRAVWRAYGAPGLSWWSWEHTTSARWTTLIEPTPIAPILPDPGWPTLEEDSSGDQVIWLQQYLRGFSPSLPVTGKFGSETEATLKAFQQSRGLEATGVTDAATWEAVLKLRPVVADFS